MNNTPTDQQMARAQPIRHAQSTIRPAREDARPPFTVEIAIGTQRYSVTGSPTGDVRAVPVEGATHAAMALR